METGVEKDTVFLCFQLRSIHPLRLVDTKAGRPVCAGRMSRMRMSEVDAALRRVLAL